MTAIIIEDEQLAAGELENVLREEAPGIEIIARLESVTESVKWLQENRTDLIFSDIHLGDGQSFDIFRQVKTEAPVIFITAYDSYALEAFKSRGIDYILKPFDREEIRQVVEKILNWFGEKKASVETELPAFQERFLVMRGTRIRSVPVPEIAYFMADGKYLMLYTSDGERYVVDGTMAAIEKRLNPQFFFRINRKFIVRYAAIQEMVRYSNSRLKVVLSPLPPEEAEVFVSSERLRDFKEWLNR